jgi:hypothetical protein
MGALQDWWQNLTRGHKGPEAAPRPVAPRKATPAATAGGLEIAPDLPARRASRTGAAGFDPYSSDAGFSKPHSWERLDHD